MFLCQNKKELVYMAMLISSKSAINKMDASNVARSLAPGLMRSETGTDMIAMVFQEKKKQSSL
jgi:hypothetical protein